MKAIVKIKPEKGIWMTDVPMPVVGPNDVLIKVKNQRFVAPTFTSISGTNGRKIQLKRLW